MPAPVFIYMFIVLAFYKTKSANTCRAENIRNASLRPLKNKSECL